MRRRARPGYLQAFVRPGEASADGSTHPLRRFRDGEITLGARGARLEDLYAAGVRQMDDGIARPIAALRDAGHADDALLVVTSDHGEEFPEHGGVLHGRTQFDEVLRVPLILSGPRVPEGLRVRDPASLIDVVPTALSLLGLPPRDGFDGIDLASALGGDPLPERLRALGYF